MSTRDGVRRGAEHQASERVRKKSSLRRMHFIQQRGFDIGGESYNCITTREACVPRMVTAHVYPRLGEALTLSAGATGCPLGGEMSETLYFSSVDRRCRAVPKSSSLPLCSSSWYKPRGTVARPCSNPNRQPAIVPVAPLSPETANTSAS